MTLMSSMSPETLLLIMQTVAAFGLWLINATQAVSPILLAWITYKMTIQSRAMVTLEQNTNSIKDALVKETQESYKAKGVLQEKQRQEDALPAA